MGESDEDFHSSDEDDYEGDYDQEFFFADVEPEIDNNQPEYPQPENPIPPDEIPNFPRKTKKDGNFEHEWVLVSKNEDLPTEFYYENLFSSEFFISPKIHPSCNKNLNSPLESVHSFLEPLLIDTVRFTSENRRTVLIFLLKSSQKA